MPGPPDNFCDNKANGAYADPNNGNKFFQCSNGIATACLPCAAPNLVFQRDCNRCLEPGKRNYLFASCNEKSSQNNIKR